MPNQQQEIHYCWFDCEIKIRYAQAMDQYIIIKVREAKARQFNFRTGTFRWAPTGRVGVFRRAIHKISEDYDLSVADMVTHSVSMTPSESETVARIFETAMDRAKSYQ